MTTLPASTASVDRVFGAMVAVDPSHPIPMIGVVPHMNIEPIQGTVIVIFRH